MGVEAALYFGEDDYKGFIYRLMRSGHLISKSRFIAAQIIACLDDQHWMENAKHANQMPEKLAVAI